MPFKVVRHLLCTPQEFMADSFQRDIYGSNSVPAGAHTVPCAPVKHIFETFGITHIDFFSLDVEGAELEVLKTLNFSNVHINVFVIEQDGRNPEKDEAVRQLLLANNFELDTSIKEMEAGLRNDWFVNKHFKRSQSNAANKRHDAGASIVK